MTSESDKRVGYVLCDSTGVVKGPFPTLKRAIVGWEGALSLRRQTRDGIESVSSAEYDDATRLARQRQKARR